MHVVLISQCEKKAILRTAKILDSYAVRHGDRTWITPITGQGLDALYNELRSRATRQSAVACYVNDGTRRLKLLWTVGKKSAFGAAGAVSVATKSGMRKPDAKSMPKAIRLACLLAECAGLVHDFGKFGAVFQKKLDSPVPLADPVRHEWISLQLLLGLLEGRSWEEAWGLPLLRMSDYYTHAHGFSQGLQTIEAVLAYLVVTHHRLPRGQLFGGKRLSKPGDEEYIRTDLPISDNPFLGTPPTLSIKRIDKLLLRIRAFELQDKSPEALRAIATLARMALILADHHISSIDRTNSLSTQSEDNEMVVFANTRRNTNGRRVKNQTLNWHLNSVGNEAGEMVQRMMDFKPPSLGEKPLSEIRRNAAGRYEWQNTCADALSSAQSLTSMPTLVINIAGTGCGKTRMNVRAIAALRPVTADGAQESVRIAAALNLRTLTLQTRDAYAEQLGLKTSELACVLGSQIAIKLHIAGKPLVLDDDENEYEDVFDFDGETPEVPQWLSGFLKEKPVLGPLIMSPVVVSTVDFLINAGEPHRQGNHGLAMLRAIHSDLILDEVDAYDTKALAAVARLVTAYAMWGRHVIASSATLSPPVARVLFDAFSLGVRMMNAMQGTNSQWRQAIIEDRTQPTIQSCTTSDEFLASFDSHIEAMMAEMGQQSFRPAELQVVSKLGGPLKGAKNFLESVQAACIKMHERHHWQAPKSATSFSGRMSIGLVRVANIKTAMLVARSLADSVPNVRVCCYHSQVGLLQRWNIERTLDALLTRKDALWMQRTVQSPYVIEAISRAAASKFDDLTFIVVATPVEEIGRDHDFDWAVIEPSSSQSIVQTVGRVNRHRLMPVESPNVAILQYNFRTCTQSAVNPVFCKPGLETDETMDQYGNHDLADLLDWTMLSAHGQIDARVRYQPKIHEFSRADNASLVKAIEGHMTRFLSSDKQHWLMKDTYLKAPLRDKGGTEHQEFYRNSLGNYFQLVPSGKFGGYERSRAIARFPDHIIQRHPNDWLVLSEDDTIRLAAEVDITYEQATSVQISSYDDDHPMDVTHDKSFGYRSQRAKY